MTDSVQIITELLSSLEKPVQFFSLPSDAAKQLKTLGNVLDGKGHVLMELGAARGRKFDSQHAVYSAEEWYLEFMEPLDANTNAGANTEATTRKLICRARILLLEKNALKQDYKVSEFDPRQIKEEGPSENLLYCMKNLHEMIGVSTDMVSPHKVLLIDELFRNPAYKGQNFALNAFDGIIQSLGKSFQPTAAYMALLPLQARSIINAQCIALVNEGSEESQNILREVGGKVSVAAERTAAYFTGSRFELVPIQNTLYAFIHPVQQGGG
ncbi:MAG: hypothetical protein QE278_07655 [Limnobacter sp.]|nr:hypothetical protein [Limnobacter sp.]